jgi:hypothetical protein
MFGTHLEIRTASVEVEIDELGWRADFDGADVEGIVLLILGLDFAGLLLFDLVEDGRGRLLALGFEKVHEVLGSNVDHLEWAFCGGREVVFLQQAGVLFHAVTLAGGVRDDVDTLLGRHGSKGAVGLQEVLWVSGKQE